MNFSLPPKERYYLIALLVFFIAKSVLFSFIIPLGQAPDEESHIDYIHWLIEKHTPPRIGDPLSSATFQLYGMGFPPLRFEAADDGRTRLRFYEVAERDWTARGYVFDSVGIQTEGAQPPLYYGVAALLTAPFHEWIGPLGFWRIARMVSILFGCIAVIAAWFLGRELAAGEDLLLKYFPAIMVALHPMTSFVMSIVTNDAALIALSFIFFAQVTLRRGGWWCAMTAALLLLTKASAVAAIAWWIVWWLVEGKRKRDIAIGLLIAICPVAIWLLLTWTTRGTTAYFTFISKVFPHVEHGASIELAGALVYAMTVNLWLEFGGIIGWLGKAMPPWWHETRACITLAIIAVAFLCRKRRKESGETHGRGLLLKSLSFLVLWWLMLTLGGWNALRLSGNHPIQGRLMLPCLLPILCMMQWALVGVTRFRRPIMFLIMGVSLIGCEYMILIVPFEYYYEVTLLGNWKEALAAGQPSALNDPVLWAIIIATAIAAFGGAFAMLFIAFIRSILQSIRQDE